MCELGTKCLKRLAFPNSSETTRFVHEFFQSEVGTSNRFYIKVGPQPGEDVEVSTDFDIRIHSVDPIPGNQSTDAKRLDASLLDGMLRHWKGNLVQLEDCVSMA